MDRLLVIIVVLYLIPYISIWYRISKAAKERNLKRARFWRQTKSLLQTVLWGCFALVFYSHAWWAPTTISVMLMLAIFMFVVDPDMLISTENLVNRIAQPAENVPDKEQSGGEESVSAGEEEGESDI